MLACATKHSNYECVISLKFGKVFGLYINHILCVKDVTYVS
jgi:hypothetical protein